MSDELHFTIDRMWSYGTDLKKAVDAAAAQVLWGSIPDFYMIVLTYLLIVSQETGLNGLE